MADRNGNSVSPIEQNALVFTVLSRQILGRQGFIKAGLFCLKLFQSCRELAYCGRDYLVVLTNRRDEVVLQQYLEYFRAIRYIKDTNPPEASRFYEPELDGAGALTEEDLVEFNKHCVTESNLMALVPAIAGYYREHKRFPHITLLDMFMLHGRTANRIFLSLEAALVAELKDEMGAKPDLSPYVEVRVYAERDDTTLLIDRLAKHRNIERLVTRQTYDDIYARLLRLRSAVGAGGDGSSLYLRLPHGRVLLDNTAPSTTTMAETYYFSELVTHYIELTPRADYTSIASIVSVRTPALPVADPFASTERCDIISPCIFIQSLDATSIARLYSVILDDVPEDVRSLMCLGAPKLTTERENAAPKRIWAANITKLVLEYLLLRRTLGSQWDRVDTAGTNIESLSRQFHTASALHIGAEDDGEALLKALLKWQPPADAYDRYISVIANRAGYIWSGDRGLASIRNEGVSRVEALIDIQDEIALALADISYAAEQSAYSRVVSSVPFSEEMLSLWGSEQTYRKLVDECAAALQGRGMTATVYDVFAVLARLYDWGAFDITLDMLTGDYKIRA